MPDVRSTIRHPANGFRLGGRNDKFLANSRNSVLNLRGFIIIVLALGYFVPSAVIASHPPLILKSPAFSEGGNIPPECTCDGKDRSPALEWARGPEGTLSFALIMEDPDAPNGNWIHWVLYNLPPPVTNIPSGIPPIEKLANGEDQGRNDFGKIGYGGPCPPAGTHRYFFRIYALDIVIPMKSGATALEIRNVMEGHILAEGEVMGKYSRPGKSS